MEFISSGMDVREELNCDWRFTGVVSDPGGTCGRLQGVAERSQLNSCGAELEENTRSRTWVGSRREVVLSRHRTSWVGGRWLEMCRIRVGRVGGYSGLEVRNG